jgi:hypothetical protein
MAHLHEPGHQRPYVVAPLPDNVVPLRRELPGRLISQWPSLSVQALVLISVAAIFIDFRLSVGLLAIAVATAFGLRLLLPRRRIGWLEVRRKRTDLYCLGLLLIGVVALLITTPSR